MNTPQRIVCLSAEAADWLGRIGAWDRVAGVTAFFTEPPGVEPKPRVGGFSTTQFHAIERLDPDLVITFSDVQAGTASELLKQGYTVLATNQRTLAETEATLALLGRIVDRELMANRWLQQFREQLAPVEIAGPRPRVYFEEWNEPLVSGIAWVSELVERAGGDDIFVKCRRQRAAADRVVQPEQVRQADPEIILASWCGKPLKASELSARPGWSEISAIKAGQVHELPAEDILQPGFRLVFGYERMKTILSAMEVAEQRGTAIER